ncbi:MAG: phage tail assembly chaperone, partial [Flavobacteriales bacterium]
MSLTLEEIRFQLNMFDVKRRRNYLLHKSDNYARPDWPHATPEIRQGWLDQRQTLRDLPTLVTPLEGGSMKLWVTNQNGPLQAGDSLVTSNVAGYFTKGVPAVVTIKDACAFSASTTETYYSNIAGVTESNVVTTSETPQEGYTENAYWTSNSVSYYTGNVVTHYSNVVVYDGVNVHTNVEVAEYSNLTVETQGNYTAVSISQDSVEEVEGYTPVLSYSNVSSDRYDAN